MTLIDELFNIEREAGKTSPIHSLDSRIKIIFCICGLFAAVFLPYSISAGELISWKQTAGLLAVFLLFIAVYVISGASLKYYLLRLCLILPFGIFIIILQPFFFNPYYQSYHIIFTVFGISAYWESLIFALSLFAKLVISISFIILLSATTTSQELLNGAARMHIPKILITVLTLTIRYLYVFAEMFRKIILAFSCRGFEHWGQGFPLRYRLNVIGEGAGTLFIRSLEQGERTYTSMCCRGYTDDSNVYVAGKKIGAFEWVFLAVGILYLIFVPVMIYLVL